MWVGKALRFIGRFEIARQIEAEKKILNKYAEIKYYAQFPWRAEDDDRMVRERRRGELPWNGADTREGAFHVPFTSSVYPKVKLRIPVRNEMIP